MATKRKSIGAELHIGEVDDDELCMLLTSVLPRGAQFRPNEVEYRTMDDHWALTLKYQNGRVIDAVAGPAMSPELAATLENTIHNALLALHDDVYCRWTLFSSHPVEGFWQYGDQFQIVPAPPEAPRAVELMADHPFILDFRFTDSSHFLIRNRRYIDTASKLALLLNVLLVPSISTPSPRPRKHWVVLPGDTPKSTNIAWAQEGYVIPNFTFLVTSMPQVSGDGLTELPADVYYDYIAGHSDTLAIPAQLGQLVDIFSSLNNDDQERFLRASYWVQTASKAWDFSQSLHLTSLINAIECLASVGPERSNPQGPSALFKSFMRTFAPGDPSGSQLDSIYNVRGAITHGDKLLSLDQTTMPFGLSQDSALDREVGEIATVLCRGALLNWLWSNEPTSTEPLLTRGLRRVPPSPPGTRSAVRVNTPDR